MNKKRPKYGWSSHPQNGSVVRERVPHRGIMNWVEDESDSATETKMNGWRYSEPTFRTRFAEAVYDSKEDCCTLLVHCEELIDGRWEGFISMPDIYWTAELGWRTV